ncbi:hypothetical protein HQ535_16720 [bacterium]|nr:hypothetical protein [bacterium]
MTTQQTPAPQEDKRKQRLPWILLFVTVVIAGVIAIFAFVIKDDGTVETSLSPDQILALQTTCFENDPPLFYDENGACYSVDPATLSDAEKANFRVAAVAAATTTTEAPTTTQGPSAPTTTQGPSAPTTTQGPSAPITTSGTASSTTTATTTGTAATTTTTTTGQTTTTMTLPPGPPPVIPLDHADRQECFSCHSASNTDGATLPANPDHMGFPDTRTACLDCHTEALAPVTIASSEWVLRLTPTHETIDGTPVSCSNDPKPPHCQDALNGSFNFRFEVNEGTVSGEQYVSNLEKTVTMSGHINPNGIAKNFKAALSNNSGVQQTLTFTGGQLTGMCSISGPYSDSFNNISGTYTMERNGPGC